MGHFCFAQDFAPLLDQISKKIREITTRVRVLFPYQPSIGDAEAKEILKEGHFPASTFVRPTSQLG